MIRTQKKLLKALALYITCTPLVHVLAKKRAPKAVENTTQAAETITLDAKSETAATETEATPSVASVDDTTQQTTHQTLVSSQKKQGQAAEYVTITNRIKPTEIPHTSKWGTYAPKKFEVTLTVRLTPEKSVTLPRALLESGDVDIQCDFTFKQGFYSRSETYAEQLKIPQGSTDTFDLAFQWEKPRFSLQAQAESHEELTQTVT